jgi:hypothetical protein
MEFNLNTEDSPTGMRGEGAVGMGLILGLNVGFKQTIFIHLIK